MWKRTDSDGTVSFVTGMRKLQLTGLGESAKSDKRTFANARKRFKRAREEATRAFANEALKLSDRVLAMQYRVTATILENVEHPTDALITSSAECVLKSYTVCQLLRNALLSSLRKDSGLDSLKTNAGK